MKTIVRLWQRFTVARVITGSALIWLACMMQLFNVFSGGRVWRWTSVLEAFLVMYWSIGAAVWYLRSRQLAGILARHEEAAALVKRNLQRAQQAMQLMTVPRQLGPGGFAYSLPGYRVHQCAECPYEGDVISLFLHSLTDHNG